MSTYQFYGASDDCCEVEGDHRDEYYANEDGMFTLSVHGGGGQMYVVYRYDHNGTWQVYPSMVDEDVPLPDGLTITTSVDPNLCRYSTVLTIEAPHALTITPEEGTR